MTIGPSRLRIEQPVEWIAKRIAEAKKAAPVSEAVASLLEKQLSGPLRDSALRRSELADLAEKLISASAPSKSEGKS
jgi:hypothetical protein